MSFIEDFTREQTEAREIVLSRDREGRNASAAVKEQFESSDFVLNVCLMKIQRAKSYLAAGNVAKFKEEMQDVANYAIFTIVFEQSEDPFFTALHGPGSWPPGGKPASTLIKEGWR